MPELELSAGTIEYEDTTWLTARTREALRETSEVAA
jgi:hypothetical protein